MRVDFPPSAQAHTHTLAHKALPNLPLQTIKKCDDIILASTRNRLKINRVTIYKIYSAVRFCVYKNYILGFTIAVGTSSTLCRCRSIFLWNSNNVCVRVCISARVSMHIIVESMYSYCFRINETETSTIVSTEFIIYDGNMETNFSPSDAMELNFLSFFSVVIEATQTYLNWMYRYVWWRLYLPRVR